MQYPLENTVTVKEEEPYVTYLRQEFKRKELEKLNPTNNVLILF